MASRSIVRFVDSIVASPGVLLDLNQTGGPLMIGPEGIDLSPPPIRRSTVSGFLGVDGDPITATAAGNRTIKLSVKLVNCTAEQAATAIQNLTTRLSVDGILMVQLDGMTKPVYFQTYAAPDYTLRMLRLLVAENTTAVLEIPAMSYGLGEKVTLSTVTVINDPTKTATLNANPYFETNAASWTFLGTSFARSTAQFHEGAASGLLTPDGVSSTSWIESEHVTGQDASSRFRADAWVRCAVSRNVDIQLIGYDAADAFVNFVSATFAVTANTWTYITVQGSMFFAGMTRVAVKLQMTGTPAASNTLHVDEVVVMRQRDGSNLNVAFPSGIGMTFDVTGILGDVETPLFMNLSPNLASSTGVRRSAVAVRRRGLPKNLEWMLDSADATLSNQTTDQTSDGTAQGPTVSGFVASGNSNFARTDFATTPALAVRYTYIWPALTTGPAEARGVYNVYVRCRHATAGDTFSAKMEWGFTQSSHTGETVTIPATSAAANWFWFPLGTIQMPPGYDPEVDGYSNTAINAGPINLFVSFGRLTGTGTLDVDQFMMLPADDRVGLVDWSAVDNTLSAYVIDSRRNAVYALDTDGFVRDVGGRQVAGAFPMVSPGVTNRVYFVRDIGSGPLSTAGAGSGTGDINTATTTITPYYFPRYRVIRPAAS